MSKKPSVHRETLDSGRVLLRFKSLEDAFWFEKFDNNPLGHSTYLERAPEKQLYFRKRFIIDEDKKNILSNIEYEIKRDPDIQKILRQEKTTKRKITKNKFVGSFSPVDYSIGKEDIFKRHMPGKIKPTLNLAFQVGTIARRNYQAGIINIIKTVLKLKALGYNVNVDLFDSDTKAIGGEKGGYVIVNIINSSEIFNLNRFLVCHHSLFFNYTLFNCYAAKDDNLREYTMIGSFLERDTILEDLAPFYSIIGGNLTFTGKDNVGEDERRYITSLIKIFNN